jgi:ATP-dependent RNA helicase DHX29
VAVVCDSDIEPDDLVPQYLDTKAKLYEAERESQHNKKLGKHRPSREGSEDEATAKLLAKLERIETDVLFDRFVAEQQWRTKRVALERELAAKRQQARQVASDMETQEAQEAPVLDAEAVDESNGAVNDEAERIAAEILAGGEDDDDETLADLFANLPTNEVDPATGKTTTVINGADGVKVVIRDFGKWTGMSPLRLLEESCRSRQVASFLFQDAPRVVLTYVPVTRWQESNINSYQTYHLRIATQCSYRGARLRKSLPSIMVATWRFSPLLPPFVSV